MTDTAPRPTAGTRVRRLLLLVLAATVVLAPIPVGLVWAWTVHPLLVVPAYLLGIAAWLTLLSGLWALVGRVLPSRAAQRCAQEQAGVEQPGVEQPGVEQEAPGTVLPEVRSRVRMPSPRPEATAPQRVS